MLIEPARVHLPAWAAWLISHCARPTRAFFVFFFPSRMERMHDEATPSRPKNVQGKNK